MIETWEKIFGSYYYVSNLGNIKYCRYGREKIINVSVNGRGYRRISFYVNGVRVTKKVSRIVAEVFVPGKSSDNNEVNHMDGNKLNDAAYNLEWTSRSRNVKHAFDNGLMVPNKGLDHNHSKICVHIEYGYFCCINEAAFISGKQRSNMWNELNGNRRNTTKFILA